MGLKSIAFFCAGVLLGFVIRVSENVESCFVIARYEAIARRKARMESCHCEVRSNDNFIYARPSKRFAWRFIDLSVPLKSNKINFAL